MPELLRSPGAVSRRRSSPTRFQEPRQTSRLRRVDLPLLLKLAEDLLNRGPWLGSGTDNPFLFELAKRVLHGDWFPESLDGPNLRHILSSLRNHDLLTGPHLLQD